MIKKIYHGSINIIKKPEYGKGKIRNDYGLGFYCTQNIEIAKEWGVTKDDNGYANIYEIDDTNLHILDLCSSKYTVLHWLCILLQNRIFDITSPLAHEAKNYILNNFSIPYNDYDIITGFRADDSYFSFAQDFINGTISIRQLSNAMKLGKLGIQYVLKSQKAFNALSFVGYEIALSSQWYSKKEIRDKNARAQYFDFEKNARKKGDIYITQILDQEIKSDDPLIR